MKSHDSDIDTVRDFLRYFSNVSCDIFLLDLILVWEHVGVPIGPNLMKTKGESDELFAV